ncbi:MAG: Gfo/Idh/MocA family oxidoreductase [Cyanobacteriota bacterium]|nr:Gfo/Idh/MocA family oxidoreductase [Cyanobacteriota bacterium]
MKVAIVGFGFIAEKGHLPAYRARGDVRVTAVVDPITSRRAAALRQYQDVRVYESFVDLLEEYADEIDIIDVCLPNSLHQEAVRQALKAKKHVICERPVALNKEEYDGLVKLAKEQKRLLYPCHAFKFAPSVVHASYLISSGEIGEPLFASFNVFAGGYPQGIPQWKPNWRRDKSIAGGGIMVDFGLDALSMAQTLFGGSPQRISAHIRNLQKRENKLEDLVTFCLDWDGKLINVNLSLLGDSMGKSSYRIQGTKGEINIENNDVFLSKKNKPIEHTFVPTYFDDPTHSNWFHGVINDMMGSIESGNLEPYVLQEAALALEVIDKTYKSSENGGSWMPIDFVPKSLQAVS